MNEISFRQKEIVLLLLSKRNNHIYWSMSGEVVCLLDLKDIYTEEHSLSVRLVPQILSDPQAPLATQANLKII